MTHKSAAASLLGNHPGEAATSQTCAFIDALHVTFARPNMSAQAFIALLLAVAFGDISVRVQIVGGLFGFKEVYRLIAVTPQGKRLIGNVCVGNEHQGHRYMLQLLGQGCRLVADWPRLRDHLESLNARVTRVDLAVDFLNGEFTVYDAVRALLGGEFTVRGRTPKSRQFGDWLTEEGARTLYVGRAENGKQIRIYQKGRKLGYPDSKWVRVEVQFSSKGKVIPLEALTGPDTYFAGTNPLFARLIGVAATAMSSRKRERTAELSKRLFHLKQSYGAVLAEVIALTDAETVLKQLSTETPSRQGASISNDLKWEVLIDEIRKFQR